MKKIKWNKNQKNMKVKMKEANKKNKKDIEGQRKKYKEILFVPLILVKNNMGNNKTFFLV